MTSISNVTKEELSKLLDGLESSGEATIDETSDTTGTIVDHHKILWHTLTINASYSLQPSGLLLVNADQFEDKIHDGLVKQLAIIRK